MRKLIPSLLAAGLVLAGTFWILTEPGEVEGYRFNFPDADPVAGEQIFLAAGCGDCHAAPGAVGEAARVLSGGQRFPTPFGTLIAPNISPDPVHGIGSWQLSDLGNALLLGVSPEGRHYFPAFPWASYGGMTPRAVADLHAYLHSLPPSAEPSQPHDLRLEGLARRLVGLWKWQTRDEPRPVLPAGDLSVQELRGRYLVAVLGHCARCHTPVDRFGMPDTARWLTGGTGHDGTPAGPDLTPGGLGWTEAQISAYLSTGLTPDGRAVTGPMAAVVARTAELPQSDRDAIAAYLLRLPAPAPGP